MLVHATRRWQWSRVLTWFAVVGFTLAGTGCDRSPESTDETPPPRSYKLRGTVRQVSDPGTAHPQVWIHHEAVPDFVGIDGKVEPMKAMTMPFTASDTLDLSSLTPGTKIAFELTVDWSADEPGLITAIDTLPEDTVLDFDSDE